MNIENTGALFFFSFLDLSLRSSHQVLKLMPVTVDLLKQGNTGKIMKAMTKLPHADVKKNASGMIKRWKNMIRDQQDTKKKPAEATDTATAAVTTGTPKDGGFMNALNVAAAPPAKKKRRNSIEVTTNKKTTLPLDEILKASPVETKKPEAEPVVQPAPQPEPTGPYVFHNPAVEAANLALAEDRTVGVLIDEGSLARRKNRKKRNITWAPDDDLVEVSYFELSEGERKEGEIFILLFSCSLFYKQKSKLNFFLPLFHNLQNIFDVSRRGSPISLVLLVLLVHWSCIIFIHHNFVSRISVFSGHNY